MDTAEASTPKARWIAVTRGFPDIHIDVVKEAASRLTPGSPEAKEAAVILAVANGEMQPLAVFASQVDFESKETSALAFKLSAAYYLTKRHAKSATSLLLRAGDAFNYAPTEAWRYNTTVTLARPPEVRLAAVAALKNEAEYLEEWVTYHAAIGVQRFYLYENHSTDDTLGVIGRLSKSYDIRLVSFQQQPAQMLANTHFFRKYGDETEWAILMDGDEYIRRSPDAPPLLDLLTGLGDVSAVALNWLVYGSAGHKKTPLGLGIKAFQKRAEMPMRVIKSIVRPSQVIRMPNPHSAIVNGRYVTPSGRPCMPFRDVVDLPNLHKEPYSIAHYAVRSREQFERKLKRGEADGVTVRAETYFRELDRNEIDDATMAVWAPVVENIMASRTKAKA